MINIENYYITPISVANSCVFKGIATDDNYLYFTCPQRCCVIKTDTCYNRLESFSTSRPYGAICYDGCEQIFWAIGVNRDTRIYKLNRSFVEIDYITPKLYGNGFIRGISCDNPEELLICGSFGIAKLCKCDGNVSCIKSDSCNAPLYAAIAKRGCITTVGINAVNSPFLEFIDVCDKRVCCPLPCEYKIEDACVFCCANALYIKVLLTKHNCFSFVLTAKIVIKDACNCHCPPNYHDCCNDCYCKCRYDCCGDCNDCCFKPCTDGTQGASDVIVSVALIETALSHILNAEGEKLQKTVCVSNDCCQILKANESVEKTITSITHLEQILYAKLKLASELCH